MKFTHSLAFNWWGHCFCPHHRQLPCLSLHPSLSLSSLSLSSSLWVTAHVLGYLGRDAAEILTPLLPHDCETYPCYGQGGAVRDRLWERDGDTERERDRRSKRTERGKKEGDRNQGWRFGPFSPQWNHSGAQFFQFIVVEGEQPKILARYWGWPYRCWWCVCWVLCSVRWVQVTASLLLMLKTTNAIHAFELCELVWMRGGVALVKLVFTKLSFVAITSGCWFSLYINLMIIICC